MRGRLLHTINSLALSVTCGEMCIRDSSSRVENCAPAREWMWVEAQRPKAAEPPALFIRATRMPSITRKIRMPTLLLSDNLATMPPSSLKNRVLMAKMCIRDSPGTGGAG